MELYNNIHNYKKNIFLNNQTVEGTATVNNFVSTGTATVNNLVTTGTTTIPNVIFDSTDLTLSTNQLMISNGTHEVKQSAVNINNVVTSNSGALTQNYLVQGDASSNSVAATTLFTNSVMYRGGTLSNGSFLVAGAGSLLTSDVRVNLQAGSDLTLSGGVALLGNTQLSLKSQGSGNIVLSTTGTGQISTVMAYNSTNTVSAINLVSTQSPSMLKTCYAYFDGRSNAIYQNSGGINSVTQTVGGLYTISYTSLGLVNPPISILVSLQDNTQACGYNLLNNPTNTSCVVSCFTAASAVQYAPVRLFIQIVGN